MGLSSLQIKLLHSPPMTEVIIDQALLDTFKRRALRAYPTEYAMSLWGKIDGEAAEIHAMLEVNVLAANEDEIEFEVDAGNETMAGQGLTLLGALHSHCVNGACAPSEADYETFADWPLIGICAIRRTLKRRFVSYAFFNGKREQLELTIGEGNDKEN